MASRTIGVLALQGDYALHARLPVLLEPDDVGHAVVVARPDAREADVAEIEEDAAFLCHELDVLERSPAYASRTCALSWPSSQARRASSGSLRMDSSISAC